MPTDNPELKPEFWETRYQEDTARWDLGHAAPPFTSLLKSKAAPSPGRLIALGSGRGHDALLFAEQGFEVLGVDFAPSAVAEARKLAIARQLDAQFIQRDIFDLLSPSSDHPGSSSNSSNDASKPSFVGQFDYVLEHTCFCAIAPHQRPAYVDLVYRLLRPRGELIALFWAHSRDGGPPYGTSLDEIRDLFSPVFRTKVLERATNSVESRHPDEYLGRFQKPVETALL